MKNSSSAMLGLVLSALALTIFAGRASADLFTPEPANAPPAANAGWSQQKGYCNSVCSSIVNGEGKVLGLEGNVGWTVADDLWCANHGSRTNPLVAPSPNPSAANPPIVSCPVTLVAGDTNCNQAVARVAHCGWHNGQLEQQCEAYEAAGGSNVGEKAVLSLDIAAAGTCAAACAMGHLGGPLIAACNSAGMVASTTELVETLIQKSSAMAKVMSAASSAMGIAMTLRGVNKTFGGSFKNAFGTGKATKGNGTKSHAACMSAIMFASMTGMRYGNIHSAQSTQQNACSEVQQLASAAPTIGNGGIPVPPQMQGENSSAQVAGGGTGATNTEDSSLRCVGSGGSISSCTGQGVSASSPDVSALQSSGLGQQLAPAAAQIAGSSLGGSSAGNAVGGAASGAGAPADIAGAVSTVAAAAQEQSRALFDKVGSMSGGGGGGGGAGGSGDAQPDPMAMLAGLLGQGKNGTASSGGMNVFQGAPENHDIWHQHSSNNLFQIVSDRIQKDSARLH